MPTDNARRNCPHCTRPSPIYAPECLSCGYAFPVGGNPLRVRIDPVGTAYAVMDAGRSSGSQLRGTFRDLEDAELFRNVLLLMKG